MPYTINIGIIKSGNDLSSVFYLPQGSENLDRLPERIWGFLISASLPLLRKAQEVSVQLQDCARINASSTASESDTYGSALSNDSSEDSKKFINTGLIDRYASQWGINPLTHKGDSFITPYLNLSDKVVSKERKLQYRKPKIIFSKMALRVEAFLDNEAEFASANTNFVYESKYDLHYILTIVNSELMSALYSGYFGALIMSGGYFQYQAPQLRILPIRGINFTTSPNERARCLDKARLLYQQCVSKDDQDCVLGFVKHHLSKEPEESDVVHDLLAFLAEEMLRLNKEKRALQKVFLDYFVDALQVKSENGKAGIEVLTGKGDLHPI